MRQPSSTVIGLAAPLALAALAVAGPVAPAAAGAAGGCVTPQVVGVSLAAARRALGASGCPVVVRQLPGNGRYRAPSRPDERQIVARQAPPPGSRAAKVTVWLSPLCVQPAQPGPPEGGGSLVAGPTELVAGLYLSGGPLVSGTSCRTGRPVAGTLTVLSAQTGRQIAARTVNAGRFAIFPLRPGRYLLSGTLAGHGSPVGEPRPFTVVAGRTRRLNLVQDIP